MATQETFSNYMINHFNMIAELSSGEQARLLGLFNSVYGNDFDVQSFMDEFGFEKKDFIRFYDFLRNQVNYFFVKAFGMKCHLNRVNKLQSGKGLN